MQSNIYVKLSRRQVQGISALQENSTLRGNLLNAQQTMDRTNWPFHGKLKILCRFLYKFLGKLRMFHFSISKFQRHVMYLM